MANFCFTDAISEADVAIFPVDIISFLKNDKINFFNDWIAMVSKYDLPIWIYAAGDFGFSSEIFNVTTFRLGGFKSKLNTSTNIIPSFINDPYKEVLKNDFFLLPKKEQPNIGFVGNANGSFLKICKEFVLYAKRNLINILKKSPEDYHPFYPSGWKRFKLLQKIVNESKIESNFIFRKKYRAQGKNAGSKEDTTLEFFNNIQNNLYVFCLRGNGNFSVRFYEALIMGRIPVLVDTDVKLPLENIIDWKQHCLIVSENSIIEDLIYFHESKTQEELKEIQKKNRKLVLEKLNRIDYFIQISNEYLRNK
ncbi:exostosin domain-containing protein [Flavobacterium panacagri]|uniref:exostosin domain-containing protein n=1 Tax=Flavobacterium panacagri TaxID=3034146 RepID=UPI0025A52639|nr:exostosin family protein [Flavobacterium panacagri]